MITLAYFGEYNRRRYSSPWGAVVTMSDDKLHYDFRAIYSGQWRNGEAGDVVMDDKPDGTILAAGQRDRRGNNTSVYYYIVRENNAVKITRAEAINHLGRKAQKEKQP